MQMEHDKEKILKQESEAKWVMVLFLLLTLGASIIHFGLAIFCATIAIVAATKVYYWETVYRLEELDDLVRERQFK